MDTMRILLLLVTLLAPATALACTCSWAGPFTKVALAADLVVLGEVHAYHRHGMDVEVLEVLRGREAISFCGEHWLEARGDRAVGRITVEPYGQVLQVTPFADVLAWVRSGGATPLAPVTLR